MDMNEFARMIRDAVEKRLDDSYRVDVRTVKKNNGVEMTGLVIMAPCVNVFPTIYLESFHENYEDGAVFEKIVDSIMEIYSREVPES